MKNDPLQGSMILIHGPPKVGKTQLASKFPSLVCWTTTEPSHKYIPEDQQKTIKLIDPLIGWPEFKERVKELSALKKPRGNVEVIDTIGGLYTSCLNGVCIDNKWDYPDDAPHGKGWSAVRNEFYLWLQKFVHYSAKWNNTTILIDHSKEETITPNAGAQYIKINCAMPGQARSIVLPVPDHIWFLGYADKDPNDALKVKTSQRALFISGTSNIEAGCRDPKVTTEIIMPLSKKNPYGQILHKLYGETE